MSIFPFLCSDLYIYIYPDERERQTRVNEQDNLKKKGNVSRSYSDDI